MPRPLPLAVLALFAAGLAGCGRKTEPAATSAESAPTRADRERLRGLWEVESYDDAGETDSLPPKEKAVRRADTLGIRVVFTERNGVTALAFVEADEPDRASPVVFVPYSIDEAGDPKRIVADWAGEFRAEWPYRFDGDVLVLAVTFGPERPAELKAKKGGTDKGVLVLRLKKAKDDEPPPPRGTRK